MVEPELNSIKKIGNSLGVILDRRALEKVYGLSAGSEIEIEYKYPTIIIRAAKKKSEEG